MNLGTPKNTVINYFIENTDHSFQRIEKANKKNRKNYFIKKNKLETFEFEKYKNSSLNVYYLE